MTDLADVTWTPVKGNHVTAIVYEDGSYEIVDDEAGWKLEDAAMEQAERITRYEDYE